MHGLAHNILIDARSMRESQNGPSRYAENVLRNLAVIDKNNHYTIIVNNDYADFIDQPNFRIFLHRLSHTGLKSIGQFISY